MCTATVRFHSRDTKNSSQQIPRASIVDSISSTGFLTIGFTARFPRRVDVLLRNRSGQNPADGSASDLQSSGDFGFTDAGAMELPDLCSVYSRGGRPAQPFPVRSRMSKPRLGPFPKDL